MKLPAGCKIIIGQRRYKGPCEIDDKIVPQAVKDKFEKKPNAEKPAAKQDKK